MTPLPSAEYGHAAHAHIVLRGGQEQTPVAVLKRDLRALLLRNQVGKLLRSRLNPEPVE